MCENPRADVFHGRSLEAKQRKEFFIYYIFCNLHFSNMASSVVMLGKAPLLKEPYPIRNYPETDEVMQDSPLAA